MKPIIVNFDLENLRIRTTINEESFTQTIEKSGKTLQNTKLHYHTQYEIFFCQDFPIGIYTETSERSFSNTAVVIPPFFHHYNTERKSAFSFFFEISKKNTKGYDYFGAFTSNVKKDDIATFTIDKKIISYLLDLYDKPLNYLKIESLLKLIFIRLIEINSKKTNTFGPSFNNYAFEIENIINLKYNEDLTLKSISKFIHLSSKQTSRIINKKFGKSFSTILNEKRLSIAKILLNETDKSVSEIATAVGFQNENYFYVLFKKKFNVTPNKYRNTKK